MKVHDNFMAHFRAKIPQRAFISVMASQCKTRTRCRLPILVDTGDNETNINYNRCVSPVVLARENLQRAIIDGKKLGLKRSSVENLRYIIMIDRIN